MAPASPLPWRVAEHDASLVVRGPGQREDVEYRAVASCFTYAHSGDGADSSQEANARYIVHAANLYPELLAALKSCVDECERQCIGNVGLMRAALKKAEGSL